MNRLKHIVLFFLLTTISLLGTARYVLAQNSSAEPYLNSTHLYRVPMGNNANTVEWKLFNGTVTNTQTAYTSLSGGYTMHSVSDYAWVLSLGKTSSDSAYIEIKFVSTAFTAGDTWTLLYAETSAATGQCVAVRSMEITIVANDFYVVTDAPDDSDCNSWTNMVWDNTDDLTIVRDGSVEFTVYMHKNANHKVKEWSFDGKITIVGNNSTLPAADADFITAVLSSGNSNYGTYAITNIDADAGTFTLTVKITDVNAAGYTTGDELTFGVNIRAPAISDVTVKLDISNGSGISGVNYDVVTDDNGTAPKSQTRTFWGIPNTSIIMVSQN